MINKYYLKGIYRLYLNKTDIPFFGKSLNVKFLYDGYYCKYKRKGFVYMYVANKLDNYFKYAIILKKRKRKGLK